MTHFAGVFLKRDDTRPEHYAAELKRNLSRCPGERIGEFTSDDSYICYFDISGDPDADRIDSAGSLVLVCGTPRTIVGTDTTADKRELARGLSAGDGGLRAARGVFGGMALDYGRHELRLFTDRLGVRPIYVYENEKLVAFSSVLRVLSECSFCSTDIDLLGTLETARFGGGIGARTSFAKIRAARPAEIFRINRQGVTSSFYWRWDDIEPRREWPATGASDLFDLFREAITQRRSAGAVEHAFLSGGMDSRAIVAMLRAVGAEPRTYCFSSASLLDGALSARYAEAAGVHYTRRPHYRMVVPEVQGLMAQELRALYGAHAVLPPAWSGDGGSVGFGHVYSEPAAIEALRAGQVDAAILRFLSEFKFGVPRGIFTKRAYPRMQAAMFAGIQEEVRSYNPVSRDRWLFIFLLCNEQRHHLRAHFETLDIHRLELILPFFDWEFLAYICSLPIDECLWHGAYNRFFDLLPGSARAVPWQTYPGHAPCPLPMPEDAVTQWSYRQHWRWRLGRRKSSLRALRYALSSGFPATLFDRSGVSLRALVDLAWLSDRYYEMAPVAACAEMAGSGRNVVIAGEG